MVLLLMVLLVALGVKDAVAVFRVGPVVSFPPINTPASTSTSSTPNPTPVLFFHAIDQLTACQPGSLSWVYDGPTGPLSLLVTNSNVGQNPTPTTSGTGVRAGIDAHSKRKSQDDPGTITETLTTNADPFAFNFTWQSVKLPQGYYAIVASVPGFSTESTPFFVSNGTDVSCLQATASSSASSSSATPAPTSSTTQTPDGSGASSNNGNSHTAAIVGGVIGGVVVILAVVGCLLLRLFRKRSGRSLGSSNRWGGLRSSDSENEPKESATASSKRHRSRKPGKTHTSSESAGAIFAADSAQGHSSNRSEGTIDALSPGREMPLDNAGPFATPLHSNTPDPFEDTATPLPAPRDPVRRASLSRDHAAYNRTYSGSNAVSTPSVRRASMDGYRPEAIPMAQSLSTSSATRRTGRKPVPQYDASELEGTPPENSVLGHDDIEGSSSGHYNLQPVPPSVTTLSSTLGVSSPPGSFSPKGEFVDPSRPVHYLIPDMPPSGMSRS